LQSLSRNKTPGAGYGIFFAISLFAIFLPELLNGQLIRKSEVSFDASDGLTVTANLFHSKKSNPYIILFHQELSSKGEFDSIASRFIKMNYNCLAVDLRSGDNLGFAKNETAARAKEGSYPLGLLDAAKDMEAAIDFLFEFSGKKVSLFGSASSASLAAIVGRDNEHVKAVVAFSPGEYFAPESELKNILANYPKPLFVAGTAAEFVYLSEIEGFPGHDRILFKPTRGEGLRGTSALLKENPSRDEYWLSLLLFFRSLQ